MSERTIATGDGLHQATTVITVATADGVFTETESNDVTPRQRPALRLTLGFR